MGCANIVLYDYMWAVLTGFFVWILLVTVSKKKAYMINEDLHWMVSEVHPTQPNV
jgi:hypothetical protein